MQQLGHKTWPIVLRLAEKDVFTTVSISMALNEWEYFTFPSNLSWNTHVDRITANANMSLGFIKINIKTKSPQIREMAYQSLVRPQLEYASAVWDPHTKQIPIR